MNKQEPFDLGFITDEFLKSLTHTAQNPGLTGYKPHDSQLKFHESDAKEKLYIGGNRSGKTVGSMAEAAMWLTGEHPYRSDIPVGPKRGRIVAVDIEDGIKKIVLPELKKWIPPRYLFNGKWEDSYEVQSKTLRLNNGSFVEFMSYEQEVEKFAGTSRHFVAFDEEPPEDIFNECLMRLVDTDGSYWIAMTPLVEMTWVVDRIYEPWEKGDQSIFVLEVNTEENPHINIGALDRITRGLTEEEKQARRQGRFINRTGLVYPQFIRKDYTVGGHLLPDISTDLPEFCRGMQFVVGMDQGYANPCAFIFCAINSKEQLFCFDEIYVKRQTVKQNAELYLSRIEQLGIKPLYVVGDPSIRNTSAITNTSIQSEFNEHGVGIALGHNSILPGVARVQNRLLENKLFVSVRCENLLREFSKYRWDRFTSSKIAARRNEKEKPVPKDDHLLDALRYVIMSRPALDGEVEVNPINWLNASEPATDFDYEKMFSNSRQQADIFDEELGIVW